VIEVLAGKMLRLLDQSLALARAGMFCRRMAIGDVATEFLHVSDR
jgi:hypothetical protein